MATEVLTEKILKKMVTAGLLKEEDLFFLLNEKKGHGQTLTDLILTNHLMTDKQLIAFLSLELRCPPVNPNNFVLDEDILRLIPASFAHKHRTLPISKHEGTLTVAMENPNDLPVIDDLKALTNMKIHPAIALSREMSQALIKCYSAETTGTYKPEETIEQLIRIVQESKTENETGELGTLLRQAQETPVIKVANLLLLDAIRRKASDLFVEPWENMIRVRCRVDGLLEEIQSPPKNMGLALVSRFKVMSQLDIAERRKPQDGRFKIKVQDREVDIRVSILPTAFGEKVCLRVLDKRTQAHSLSKLGFTDRELSDIKACASKPHGMILVTGPTGSGKTTTLYSILKHLDSVEKNITTVEDPVEYEVDGINQVHVRESIGLSFPVALRSILRQDPNVILIGEIRDQITMDIAIKSALTGHLVLSTLHTNDASSSIVRIFNMGIEPFLITSSTLMISAQRLVRKLCQNCKGEFAAEKELVTRLNLDPKQNYTFYRPVGCPKCRATGYAGRVVVSEILVLTPEVKTLIMKRANGEEIKQCARRQGMTTLRESGVQKALAGETSLDEVFRVTAGDQEFEVD